MPSFSSKAVVAAAESLSGDGKKAAPKTSALISCGSRVRVVKSDRARRAEISYVDEDANTVDVMYFASASGPEEEEGLPVKSVQALLPFELEARPDEAANLASMQTFYKTASAIKDEGNQLYKIKDYDAAIERYSTIVAAFAAKPRTHMQVLMVSNEGAKPELKAHAVRSCDAEGTC